MSHTHAAAGGEVGLQARFPPLSRSSERRRTGSFPEQLLAVVIEPTGVGAYFFYVS